MKNLPKLLEFKEHQKSSSVAFKDSHTIWIVLVEMTIYGSMNMNMDNKPSWWVQILFLVNILSIFYCIHFLHYQTFKPNKYHFFIFLFDLFF